MKTKLTRAALSLLTVLFCAFPVFAQAGEGGGNKFTSQAYGFIAAGIGLSLAAGVVAPCPARGAPAGCGGDRPPPRAGGGHLAAADPGAALPLGKPARR